MKEQNRIVVLGAGGNVGGKIAEELIARGEQVRVVGRSRARLSQFEGRAEICEGDFSDDAFLQQAFTEVTSLFLTVPDEALIAPLATAERLKRLLLHLSVTHVVNISNCILKKAGAPTRLVAFEKALNTQLPQLNLLHLRCANFFENLNWGFQTPYLPDLRLPYISAHEVAHVAADHLQLRNFEGKQVRVLLGEKDYSMEELAATAGIIYQQQPYTPANIDFYKPFNEGNFDVEQRTEINTAVPSSEKFTLAYFLQNELKQAEV